MEQQIRVSLSPIPLSPINKLKKNFKVWAMNSDFLLMNTVWKEEGKRVPLTVEKPYQTVP